jgi:hypothetical protein
MLGLHHGDPARSELAALKRVLHSLKSSPAQTRSAVGTGVSLANTDFMRRFGGLQSFREGPSGDREQFLATLGDLEIGLRSRDPGMALGVGLYRMWLIYLFAGRRATAELLGEELTELSRKASRLRCDGES